MRPLNARLMLAWGTMAGLTHGGATLAQIVVDPTAAGSQRPTVTTTGSQNVPLVNIQTPSAAGVSRNTYAQFDVQRNGVILNNSRTITQTQLGGWVQGNPWLAAGSARVILNEVTSGSPSQLKGFMEVAGQRAQVVVANPAGITCDGCGFINASRSTLTTGTPLMSGGSLQGWRVTGGVIEVTGAGLQGSGSDYTDLISRAVKVNAGIWAQRLQVTTGVNQVSVDSSNVVPLGTGQATGSTPAFALDTALLGGMYAGKIVLVGTEAGLGMRNAGQISAASGSLSLTHDGRLINTGLLDGQDAAITAAAIDNLGSGRIYGDQLTIAAGTLTQTGQAAQTSGNPTASPVIAARQHLEIGAGTIQNNEAALIFSAGDLFVGGVLDDGGQAVGLASLLNNVGGTIQALGNLGMGVATLNNSNAGITTQEVESLTAHQEFQLSGRFGRWEPAQVTIVGRDDGREVDYLFTPEGDGEDFNRYDYTRVVREPLVVSSRPGDIVSGGDLLLGGTTLNNTDSRIWAGGELRLQFDTVNHVATHGTRSTTEQGTVTHLYRIQRKGRDRQGQDVTAYAPPPTAERIALSPGVIGDPQADIPTPDLSDLGNIPASSSLLVTTPTNSPAPLIEVDPRFANQRQWLSSDYLLRQLSIDPAAAQKRLGDGFYEQSLVRDQIAQLSGHRFLEGYSSDEAQYRALLDNAVTVARSLNVRPGVALSAEQVAQLTSDIVWLQTTTVTLPDGRTTQVLAPQVYLRPRPGDLQPGGALLSARNLVVQAGKLVSSGAMEARQALSIAADTIGLDGGSLAAQTTRLQAAQDIVNAGAQISGRDELSLQAGRDITLATTTATTGNAQGSRTYTDRVASLYVSGAAGQLLVAAGRDVALQGAQIAHAGEAGQTRLAAGRDLTLGTVQTAQRNDIVWNAKNQRHDTATQEVGSSIRTQGHIDLQAGQDLTVRAAEVLSTGGALTALAGGQARIEAGQSRLTVDESHESRSRGFLSSKTISRRDTADHTLSQASTLSGATVDVRAGQGLAVTGSHVVSDAGTQLQAQGDVRVQAAQEHASSTHDVRVRQSGLMSSGGIGFAIGSRRQQQGTQLSDTTAAASTVGATAGDVRIQAGQGYRQSGSDVLAPAGNIDIRAQQVTIDDARQRASIRTEQRVSQSGLSVSVGGGILDTAQATAQAVRGVRDNSGRNQRLNTLIAYGQGADLYEQGQAVAQAAQQNGLLGTTSADGKPTPGAAAVSGVKLSISVGQSRSRSDSSSTADTAAASTVKAGGAVHIQATQGDLTLRGSTVQAAQDATLSAAQDVALLASADTASNRSSNHSSAASVGLGVGVGSGSAGLSVDVAASRGKGQANSDSLTYRNSLLSAGNQARITSGADTRILGGNVAAAQVTADVGGNLHIQSLQDTASSHARQHDSGFAASVPIGAGSGSASLSLARQKSDSSYLSVAEQSGIQAGSGGFQINVSGDTALQGAVIASTADGGHNRLRTGTLTTSDLHNTMSASASSSGLSVGTTLLQGKYAAAKDLAGNLLNHGQAGLSDASTTRTAISAAQVTVGTHQTDTSRQQLIDSSGKAVSTDTQHTSRTLAQADVDALEQQARQKQADNLLVLKAATAFTNPAFKTMFLKEAKIYAIVKDENGNPILDKQFKPQFRELNAEEKANLQPGPDGKVHIANNGIFNGSEFDPSAAAKYAQQNNSAAYFIHFPQASNAVSELLIAGYQKHLESAQLGLTNATQEVKTIMQQYGQAGLQLDGHSRGSMTIGNAMESLAKDPGAAGLLSNTTVNFYGPAYSAQKGDELLSWLQSRDSMTPEQKDNAMLMFQNHNADPVGRAPLIGGNPGTGGTIPKDSSTLVEQARAVTGLDNTVHNCYGSGAVDGSCQKYWKDTAGRPVLKPARPELLGVQK